MSSNEDYYEALKNTGFLRIGAKSESTSAANEPAGSRPVLVLGPGRSGTSVIPGMLNSLGFYCGEQAVPPVYEDTLLQRAVTASNWSEVEKISSRYAAENTQWCFKWTVSSTSNSNRNWISRARYIVRGSDRQSVKQLNHLYEGMGKPLVIITFKDVFSIANRNRISISGDLLAEMRKALDAYDILLQFINQCQPDALLISIQKGLANKDSLLEQLIEFCVIQPTDKQRLSALEFVTPDPKHYLLSSRSDQCIGSLAPISKSNQTGSGTIGGWAKYKESAESPVVALYIDDEQVATTVANEYREDLVGSVHPQGTCAFNFSAIDFSLMTSGTVVRARVVGDSQDLSNSPQLINRAA